MQLLIIRDLRGNRRLGGLVKKLKDGVGRLLVDPFRLHQVLGREAAYLIHRAKGFKEGCSSLRADSWNLIQQGLDLGIPAQFFVVGDSEAVGFILDPRDQVKGIGMGIHDKLPVLKVQRPRPVPVILHHAGHGDVQVEFR